MLRNSLVMGFVFGFTLFSSFSFETRLQSSQAQSYVQNRGLENQHIWSQMSMGDRLIVDRIAGDFYERSLRYAQTTNIEQQTARLYTHATPAQRANYRHQRRQQWKDMNNRQRQSLRNVKRPVFMNLSPAQKWPFRQYALDQLGANGAIQPNAQAVRGVRPGI